MKKGFVLIYTILFISIMLIVSGVVFSSVIAGIHASRLDQESAKAFYVADTGSECVRYFQNFFRAFDTMTQEASYNCGIGANFNAGGNPATTECEEKTYPTIRLEGFSNGACADVFVKTIPRTIIVNGNPTKICDLSVISNGKNSCTATGKDLVERTRWENM